MALHGDLQQYERDKVIRDFKSSKVKILVATDVAARGLDIKSVKTVVNYDIAHDIDSHTHRVGRTGRAGEKGYISGFELKFYRYACTGFAVEFLELS